MKSFGKTLSLLLALLLMFSLSLTVSAEGNAVYTNGVEGSNWPYKMGYVSTITLSGATVKKYEWDGNTCDVVLVSDTAKDAEITFAITAAGTAASRVSAKINNVSGMTGTVNLVDGQASVPVYAQFQMASLSGTKTFNLSVAEENHIPTLADSEKNAEIVEVTAGESNYRINLAEIFTDADGDELSYNVSINDADPVAAEVDENGIYEYRQNVAGEYKLVFSATDSKEDTSVDTFTTNLTIKNSDVTYEAKVNMPVGMSPSVYASAGFDGNGVPLNGVELTVTEGENNSYVVSVPENVTDVNIVYGDCKQTVAVSKDAVINMRSVLVSGEDMFGTAVSVTTAVKDSAGHVVTGSGSTFVLKTGENYTITASPSDTTSFSAASSTATVEDGADQAVLKAQVGYSNLIKITAPSDADAQLWIYNQYYSNTEFICRGTVDNGNGTSTHYFSGCKTTPSNPSLIYRVEREGHITKAGWTTKDVTVTYSDGDIGPKDRVDYSTSTEYNASFTDDGVVLNINKQNNLAMSVGSSKTLKAYRVWEIIPVSYNNWIIEPDFHYNVIWESEEGVVSLTDQANNMTGGESWKTLKANKEGTAIIEVSYDAIDVRGNSYDGVYGATDPARTGLVVVQVGGNDNSVNFGIDGMASQGSVIYESSSKKAWDAEFDTLYFVGESGQLNLTPSAGSAISNVEVSNNKGLNWSSLTADENGVYTAAITSGNNIIKVTTANGVAYQVVRGDKVSVTMEELEGAENTDNDGIFESGETLRVTIDGLHSPIPKMAGNYNPGYGDNYDGYSKHHISYLQGETRVQGEGAQYNWFTETNYIDIVLPESGNVVELNNGCIGVGVIGLTGFADGGDSHRNIPDGGCGTRDSKTTFHTRSMLPDLSISVVEPATYTVTLPESEQYSIVAAEGYSSTVKEGGEYKFTLEIAEGSMAGESFAVKANDVLLTADENGVYTVESITEDQLITVEGVELDYVLGDVNNDGKINSADASLALRYAAKLVDGININAADVNADGKVNSADASLILRYAAQLITEFPVKNA